MAARSRLPLLGSLARAVRSASRPGAPAMSARLGALPRLFRATSSGSYRGTTVGRLALLGTALAYVVSPVDVLPEGLLLMFGLADDAMVLSWLAASFLNETDAYLAWERQVASGGQPIPYAAPAAYPGAPLGYPATGWPQPQDAPHASVPGTVHRSA